MLLNNLFNDTISLHRLYSKLHFNYLFGVVFISQNYIKSAGFYIQSFTSISDVFYDS